MKKLMLLSAIILNGLMICSAEKITVDNTPGSAAQHATMVAAIGAANPGDTIFVYGSSYDYGGITVNKQLVIIGSAGVDPEVTNENTPSLTSISLTTGSSGTVISGFKIGFVSNNQATVNNIGIYNNYFNSGSVNIQFYYCVASDWVIEGNVFQSSGGYTFDNYGNGSTLNNILVKNNYVEMLSYYYYVFNYNNSAFTYRNNVFVIRSDSGYFPFNASSNVLFENNIFWIINAAIVDISNQQCASCVFNNNIIYNAGGGTMTAINLIGNGVSGNNNLLNQDPQFLSFVQDNNYTIAENYKIQDASPGNNAGTDGSDIGLFGGNYNWENRKYPKAFPHQEVLNVINGSVPQGTPVNINLKARNATN